MVEQRIILPNPSGLHARPASILCAKARTHICKITLYAGSRIIDVKSILDVMAANLKQGSTLRLLCDGPDEEAALEELSYFLQHLVE